MRIYLTFLGCRLNEAELEQWRREFLARGHSIVARPEEADVCILNTCAVTGEAGRQSRQAARRLHRRNPHAHIVFAGCDAEMEPDRAANLMGVDLVVGNREKDNLVECVIEAFAEAVTMPAGALSPDAAHMFPGARTRAFVKVQDGCNNHCTFCIVTVLRGDERSRPIPEVVAEVNTLVGMGYREVVLTGVHLGGYGRDLGTSLLALVQALLSDTDVERLRLSSLEPWDIPEDFFALWDESNGRLMPHLHLPLQSGCDATLRRMGRRYTTAQYAALVRRAREHIPHLTVTTDIIVGFPGETDEEFAASMAFVEEMAFGHIHIFSYSPREGTPATRLPGHVPSPVKKARSRAMHALMRRMKAEHLTQYIGDVRPVLWEDVVAEEPDGQTRVWSGLTDNYLRVHAAVPAEINLRNVIAPTRLLQVVDGERLLGVPNLDQASWPNQEVAWETARAPIPLLVER